MNTLKQLSLSGKTIQGKIVPFPAVLELDYQEDRYVPCASLDITIPLEDESAEYCEVAAVFNGKPLFEGIVDRQITEKSDSGKLVRLECRSKTALLLDNEVKPAVYFQLTSSRLFERYAAPNGVLGKKFPYEARTYYLQVNKGSSCWDVLERFCLTTYRKQPFINRQRQLVIDADTGVTQTFSNRVAGATPYYKLTIRQKNDQYISRLHIKTATEASGSYYGIVVDNSNALRRNIKRERYYHPKSTGKNDRELEIARVLDDADRNGFEAELILPGIHAVEPGDLALLPDESISQKLIVSGVRFRASDAGITTVVLLQIQ